MVITPRLQKDLKRHGWKFDWLATQEAGNYIYALYAEGDPDIQGLISYHYVAEEDYVMVDIAESAPWNIGHNGKYIGIGGHLFGIVSKASWDAGVYLVAFNVKNGLIDHYAKTLHATLIYNGTPPRMILDPEAMSRLINVYVLRKAGD